MTKAFVVLAECVDARSGKRFAAGEEFDPAPTAEQAARLVAALCLPQSAIAAAAEAEKAAEKKRSTISKADAARLKALDDARAAAEAARISVANAETALDAADDAGKEAAQAALDQAVKDKEAADAALAELSK